MASDEKMGLTFVDATLRGPGGSRTLRFLVDSGAAYSVIPAEVGRELGAKPLKERVFVLADGRKVTRVLAELEIEAESQRATTIVILGEPGDLVLLGVYTLEGLGLELDPVNRQLRPQTSFPLMAVNPWAVFSTA